MNTRSVIINLINYGIVWGAIAYTIVWLYRGYKFFYN